MSDLHPNAALREAIVQDINMGHYTWSDLTRSLGWLRSNSNPDTSRLRRALGESPHPDGRIQQRTNYFMLVKIAAVAGYDPVDVDL